LIDASFIDIKMKLQNSANPKIQKILIPTIFRRIIKKEPIKEASVFDRCFFYRYKNETSKFCQS